MEKIKQQTIAEKNDTISHSKITQQSIFSVPFKIVCLKHLFFVSLGPDKALYSFLV